MKVRYKDFIRIRALKVTAALVGVLILLGTVFAAAVNIYVVSSTKERIYKEAESISSKYDCILVLGCSVRSVTDENGNRTVIPSDMLRDRLLSAFAAYEAGAAPKILVSGDHGQPEYDEVNTMKRYLVELGVPSEDIFMDHAGFSTYESVYRAKAIFGVKSMLISTQSYHLNRALFISDSISIEADGISADLQTYRGQFARDIREVAGRCKDFLTSVFKPEPEFLGTKIDITGNGNVTND